ncbi:MAG TPA: hypothetical protein VG028_05525 [Terriglobia bacterium]|nr:hypothetical protein [Terriglobia bacterium]
MSKKFELLHSDNITFLDGDGYHTLFRIRATKDFGFVKKGDLGGYVENEANLSHDGTAWILPDAKVYAAALVCDDGLLYGDAELFGNARLCGNAQEGYEHIGGDAIIGCPPKPPSKQKPQFPSPPA